MRETKNIAARKLNWGGGGEEISAETYGITLAYVRNP